MEKVREIQECKKLGFESGQNTCCRETMYRIPAITMSLQTIDTKFNNEKRLLQMDDFFIVTKALKSLSESQYEVERDSQLYFDDMKLVVNFGKHELLMNPVDMV